MGRRRYEMVEYYAGLLIGALIGFVLIWFAWDHFLKDEKEDD
jgi:hypothetical protein